MIVATAGNQAQDLSHPPIDDNSPDGTGLWLAIVHRIVEEHEGEIRVETAKHGGARFVVLLPGSEA